MALHDYIGGLVIFWEPGDERTFATITKIYEDGSIEAENTTDRYAIDPDCILEAYPKEERT